MIEINKRLTTRKIDTEYFILNRETSTFHSFNRTGAYIWELLNKNCSFKELVDKLMDKFDVSKKQAEEDAFSFLIKLEEENIIKIQGKLSTGEKECL